MLSVSKPSTLLQQKKQQWAREREEMSHLYMPWGSTDRFGNRLQVRNQFASSLELHKQSSYEYQEPTTRQRSPSLPPIHHVDQTKEGRKTKEVLNRNISATKRFSFYDEDGEGDTSGYGSETINHGMRNGLNDSSISLEPVLAWQQNSDDNRHRPSSGGRSLDGMWAGRSPRGTPAAEEGRPRWGDRGVATGRLWEPTAPTARLPQMPNQKKGTPSWVERGLNMIDNTAEVLIIDQRSSTNSGFECDRSSCNGSDEGKTFIRGQNVPMDEEIKAQRETKRIKALELQSALLSQLEDREKRRQEERETKLREEKFEELRIQRQQEEDRLKMEQEKRKNQEKLLLEQRKLETLKKALEDAERKARLEKEKRFTVLKQTLKASIDNEQKSKASNYSNDQKPKVSTFNNEEPRVEKDEETKPTVEEEVLRRNESQSPTKTNRTYDLHSAKSQNNKSKDFNSHQTTEYNSPRSMGPGNLNLFIHNVPPLSLPDNNQYSIVPIGINGEVINGQQNGIQLAVLVPQNLSLSLNSLNNVNDSLEGGKVLTPRKYRSGRSKDATTQTDQRIFQYTADKANETEDIEHNIDKDYSHIDENAPQDNLHGNLKKDRRFRSEDRYKKEIENRPKWGVNRPVAQYKKQSEKDPFYSQKRKMRHKYRTQTRQYLSQSSEDSRSPSPPLSRSMNDNMVKGRNSLSQSYWRNKRSNQDLLKPNPLTEHMNSSNESNLGQTGVVNDDNKKSPPDDSNKMSPNKRVTLSQKFINDKYGNRKLWVDDVTPKSNTLETDNRKKILDQINIAKRDFLDRNKDQDFVLQAEF